MQRTIKILRVALPIVFLGFVLLIVFSWDKTTRRQRDGASEPVTSTQRPEDKPQHEARAFRDVQTIGGRVVSEIVADRVVGFESGWTTLEGVRLTIYRTNGLTYQLSCPRAEFNSETKEADAKGGVRVVSSDGVEISTAEIRFDGNRLTNDIPVQFRIDRWNGNAGALDLDVQGETLRLHKEVTATMAPAQPDEVPMNLQGTESIFHRRENTVRFNHSVEMVRGAESARADFMVGRFTQDRRQLIGLEGVGHCRVVMAGNPAPGEDLGGRKEITCDSFGTEVGPDGQINAIIARAGADQPARAILDGPPKRDITARGFRIALANKAVSEIKAEWQVVMKELGDVPREIQAEHVTVSFSPHTRRASSAYLEGAFRYTDPKTTASAFRANYDIVGDRIVLTTDPGWQATVVSEGHTLKARQIEFSPRAQTARATGSVIAELKSKGKSVSADATNLFPAGKPVYVNAENLIMHQATRVAHFTGNVRAWQDTNTLLANELQVQGAGDTMTARGNVRTLLYNTGEQRRTAPVQSTSDQLIARKNDRRVDLVGNVTIVDTPRTLKSEKAAFYFDGNRKIDRIEAENNVNVAEATTARKGTGDKAIYHVEKKMIYVHGSPATMTDPSGTIAGQQIVFDLTRNRVQVVGEPKGTYKHSG
ncbi:MAG TPA: LPS export ABC transporter periplasmic protein LptC [Thermoanaerobaculia bacterium]|nr:LPS export ABC transporter periplasmic protein LptC [Thermoanaerobaculia bacterium]